MPGSIQVSVLDFKELPSSSKFVKVSLGKVEHEAVDKGTFSFPLTNLRDNLIIKIQDSEGNQISHSGFRTMSIIEKGTWDDLFPIEGGGLIHMKLQFILSDEERNRIRSMREAAMKKKQAEILGSRLRRSESAMSLTPLLHRHEVSGLILHCLKKHIGSASPFSSLPVVWIKYCLSVWIKEVLKKYVKMTTDLGKWKKKMEDKFVKRFCLDVLRDTSSQDFQRSISNSDAAKAPLLTPLDDTSGKTAESSDDIIEESFQRQPSTNSTNRKEETSFLPPIEDMNQKASQMDLEKKNEAENPKLLDDQEEKIPNDIKITTEESTSTPSLQETKVNTIKNNEIQLQERVEDTHTHAAESKPLDNENLNKPTLEEKIPSQIMITSKESKLSPSQETEVNTIKNNEKRLQETSPRDMSSSRSIISEKIKSFSPKVPGGPNKQGTPEKTPRNILKMISVFESSISQDRAPLKPTKSYKVGTLRVLKDHAVNNDEKFEASSSTRLRNSFSTGDLLKTLSSTLRNEEKDGFDDFVELSEPNMQQSKGNYSEGTEKKFALTETTIKKLPETSEENATVSGRTPPYNKSTIKNTEKESVDGRKILKDNREYKIKEKDYQEKSIKENHEHKIQEIDHQEKIVTSIPEIVTKGSDDIVKQGEELVHVSGNSSPKSTNGSFGQAIKIAIVVGFGVIVFVLRQREHGRGRKKENKHALKSQVFMNRRGSIEEQRRQIGV